MKKVATLQQKSQTWDKAGTSEADQTFQWKRHNGEWVYLEDMSTIHVWNALKIAWEKRHSKSKYWGQAIANLYLELYSRPSLTNNMKNTLKVIARKTTKR
jgi:hypothetical protein